MAVAFERNIIWSYGLYICGQNVLTNVISMAVALEGNIIYDAAGGLPVVLMVVMVLVILVVFMVLVILMVLDDETFIGEILWRRVEARQVAGES